MATLVSPNEMQEWIERVLAEQPHIGLGKAVRDIVWDAPSPFNPRASRKPKAALVVGVVLFVAAAVCFCYFNLGS